MGNRQLHDARSRGAAESLYAGRPCEALDAELGLRNEKKVEK